MNYELYVKCKNCHFEGSIEVEEGTPIEEKECPNCGNERLEKGSKISVASVNTTPSNPREAMEHARKKIFSQ